MSGGRLAGVARRLLQGVCVVYALWLVLELQRCGCAHVGKHHAALTKQAKPAAAAEAQHGQPRAAMGDACATFAAACCPHTGRMC
jgi:hypothetical protein